MVHKIFTATAKWKNGITDIEVRRLENGKFRVIDVCREKTTKQGTGISEIVDNKDDAINLAIWYKKHLEKLKGVL